MKYQIYSDGAETIVDVADLEAAIAAATEWVKDGYESGLKTYWVDAYVSPEDDGDRTPITVEIAPEEPPCVDDDDHDWRRPVEIVGGIAENPGVWGHGGGVIIRSVCLRCGCGRTEDTWAMHPNTGAEGLESIAYSPGEYADRIDG